MPFHLNPNTAHLGGRKKGSKNRRTIEIAVAEEQLRQSIMKNLTPITVAAINSTLGERFIMRVKYYEDKHGNKLRERKHEIVDSPHEIRKALDVIANDSGVLSADESDDGKEAYYYIQTKPSNTHALQVLLDRAFGKAKETKADPSANEIMLGELLRRALVKGNLQNDKGYLHPIQNTPQVNFEAHNLLK